jgi:hypothetical protein
LVYVAQKEFATCNVVSCYFTFILTIAYQLRNALRKSPSSLHALRATRSTAAKSLTVEEISFLDPFREIRFFNYVASFPRGDRREGAGKRHPHACYFSGTIRQDDG